MRVLVLSALVAVVMVGCGGRILDAGDGAVGPDDASAPAADADASDGAGDASPEPTTKHGACDLAPPGDPGDPSGGCALLGVWTITDGYTHQTADVELNADGTLYGGPPGTDFSQTYSWDGEYRIDNGVTLNLLMTCGLGCRYGATFTMQFGDSCSSLKLVTVTDNCTGGRPYFRDSPTLQRH